MCRRECRKNRWGGTIVSTRPKRSSLLREGSSADFRHDSRGEEKPLKDSSSSSTTIARSRGSQKWPNHGRFPSIFRFHFGEKKIFFESLKASSSRRSSMLRYVRSPSARPVSRTLRKHSSILAKSFGEKQDLRLSSRCSLPSYRTRSGEKMS